MPRGWQIASSTCQSISIVSGSSGQNGSLRFVQAERVLVERPRARPPDFQTQPTRLFLQIIISSKAFLLENVKGLPTRYQKESDAAVQLLEMQGMYLFSNFVNVDFLHILKAVKHRVVVTSEHGIPHNGNV